jgi:hypothetical protein
VNAADRWRHVGEQSANGGDGGSCGCAELAAQQIARPKPGVHHGAPGREVATLGKARLSIQECGCVHDRVSHVGISNVPASRVGSQQCGVHQPGDREESGLRWIGL